MLSLKSPSEIAAMARAGTILARVLKELKKHVRAGVATKELDELAHKLVLHYGAKPAFLGYGEGKEQKKFPASLCVSVNDEVVHGLPSGRVLQEGDIVGLDFGVLLDGFYTDGAITVAVGKKTQPQVKKLLEVTELALKLGINAARLGNHIGDIGNAVQTLVEKHGFGVIRQLVGHGIGRQLHEAPQVPNFGKPGMGEILQEGMIIAIEPMVAMRDWNVILSPDGWAYKTADGSLSAHFEHTVAITKKGPRVLTK